MIDATPLLKLHAARRLRTLSSEDPVTSQRAQLLHLIRGAAHTRFGRDHHFDSVRSVAEFQRAVTLRRYEQMWRQYWQPEFPLLKDCTWPGTIPYFALSSGTSAGASKYIPVSHEMNHANSRAATDVLVHHMANRPHSHVLGGKVLMLGGSTELRRLADGIYGGDLSGIAASRTPLWARRFTFPPPELALISDWERKVEAISAAVLHQDIRVIAGTPSWLLIFFEHLFRRRPDLPPRLASFFPNLEMLVHGGVNFAPYRTQFERLLEGTSAETRESYAASEGFIAVADRGPAEGMRLITDNGLFYEFVPLAEIDTQNPTRHWVANIVPGTDYAIIVSSCAGIWAYVLGDTVRFVDSRPPRLLVTGRISYSLSGFGEHLTGEEIETAMTEAAAEIGGLISDFAVGSAFPSDQRARGCHLYVVEFASPPPTPDQAKTLSEVIDRVLIRRNDDYGAHRAGDFGMDAPELIVVQRGTFEMWMKSRGRLGGQNKVPRVIADQALFENLRAFCANRIIASAQ
jgi:hypothetical protein